MIRRPRSSTLFPSTPLSHSAPACIFFFSPAAFRFNSTLMKPRIFFQRLSILLFVSLLPAIKSVAQTLPPAPSPEPSAKPTPPSPTDYDLRWDVKIPMRDKVELNATLYLPKTKDGIPPRTPVIFTLTPYISDTYHARAAYFASHGYVFALVDVRGRGNSSGEFEPFANEPRDGHDVVEW